VLGVTLVAGAVQLPLLFFGVAAAVQSSPFLGDFLRWIGTLYLMALGTRLLLNNASVNSASASTDLSAFRAMRQGAIANLTNLNPMLFMLAFLPLFVEPARGGVGMQLIVLGVTQKVMGFLMLSCAALASSAVGRWIARHPAALLWQARLSGLAIIGIGAHFLLAG
jgi:threonine/homoserine/homoserine lactone efflux protein